MKSQSGRTSIYLEKNPPQKSPKSEQFWRWDQRTSTTKLVLHRKWRTMVANSIKNQDLSHVLWMLHLFLSKTLAGIWFFIERTGWASIIWQIRIPFIVIAVHLWCPFNTFDVLHYQPALFQNTKLALLLMLTVMKTDFKKLLYSPLTLTFNLHRLVQLYFTIHVSHFFIQINSQQGCEINFQLFYPLFIYTTCHELYYNLLQYTTLDNQY